MGVSADFRENSRLTRRWLVPAALLLLAASLRLPQLAELPAALFRDELEKGYTARELAETGRYGRLSMLPGGRVRPSELLPLFIDVYGVRTSAIYQYLSAPLVRALGLSAWTTRAVAALSGILTVLFLYLWVSREWGRDTAFWAAFWLAICPWSLVFSRWAQQGITVPLWMVLSLWMFAKGRSPAAQGERARALWWMGAAFFAALAFYSYAVARLFVPLWLLALAGVYHRTLRSHWRAFAPAAILLFALALPVAREAATPAGAARFQRISILSGEGGGAAPPGAVAARFLRNWASHFSPRFLFVSGDANPRHHLPGLGVLTPAQAAFAFLGLLLAFRGRKPGGRLLLLWVALFPVSAAMTTEGLPHALRSIMGAPAAAALAGLGSAWTLRHARRRFGAPGAKTRLVLVRVFFSVIIGVSVFRAATSLYSKWPGESAAGFDATFERMTIALLYETGESPDARAPGRQQNELWLSGQIPYAPHYLLFWGDVAPRDWQARGMDALPARILSPVQPLAVQWSSLPPGAWASVLLEEAPPPDSPARGQMKIFYLLPGNASLLIQKIP